MPRASVSYNAIVMCAGWLAFATIASCGGRRYDQNEVELRVLQRIVVAPKEMESPLAVRSADDGSLIVHSRKRHRSVAIARDGKFESVELPDSSSVVADAGVTAKSVWAYDIASRRMLVRDSTGAWSAEVVPTLVPGYVQSSIGVLANSVPVFVSFAPHVPDKPDLSLVWVVIRGRTVVLDSLGYAARTLAIQGTGARVRQITQPWQYREAVVVDGNDSSVCILRQRDRLEGIVAIEITEYRLPTLVPSKRSVVVRSYPLTRRLIADWERPIIADSISKDFGGKAGVKHQLDAQLIAPNDLPAFFSAVVLDSRHLLVHRSLPDGSSAWNIVAAMGANVQRVSVPESWQLQEAKSHRVIWVATGAVSGGDTIIVTDIDYKG